MTRRQVGELLGLHPDSVTRLLPDGLAAAVSHWGGASKEMTFDHALVLRWDRARSCRNDAGRPCRACALVLEDCLAVAAHLIEARHGVFTSCGKDCGYRG